MGPDPVSLSPEPPAPSPAPVAPVPATASATPAEGRPAPAMSLPRWKALARWETGLIVALAGTLVMGVVLSPEFLTKSDAFSIGLANGEVAVMTLPMMLVIASGEIDLSIQSTLAVASSLIGYLWSHGWPMPLIIVFVLLVGGALGLVNGLLVTRLGLPSLAVTIGTLTLYAGIAEIILGSNIVSNFPARYADIGVNAFPGTGLSYSTVIFAALAVLVGIGLHCTGFGRSVFAIGANQEAARYAGIRVKRIKTTLFVFSGVVGALAGVLYTFRLSTAEYNNGNGLVLSVVAIVLLGGVSIFGGKGTVVGVVLAALVFSCLQGALLLTSFPQSASGIVTGGLLLVSILLPNSREGLRRALQTVDRWRQVGDREEGGMASGPGNQ